MSHRSVRCAVLLLAVLVVPSTAVAAEPSPVPVDRPGGSFQDDNGDPHEGYVEALAREGIVRGCDDALPRVCPGDSLTRAQLASLLARSLDLTGDGQHEFTDVEPDGAHADAIDAIVDAGIAQGCAPERFCPQATLTRAQMASMLARSVELEPVQDGPFTDVSGTHAPWINAIADAGITQGCAPDRYCPARRLPRNQMATLLGRALDVAPVEPAAPLEGTISFVHGRPLWAADPGGAERRQLTVPPTGLTDAAPVWSPSGEHVMGDRSETEGFGSQVVVADVEHGTVARLPTSVARTIWSPDGSMLAGLEGDRDLDLGTNLVVHRPDGSLVHRLAGRPTIQTHPFGWSPDGSEVLFQRTADDASAVTDLYALDITTGEERRLTGPHEGDQFDEDASVNAAGTHVAFVRTDRSGPGVEGNVDDRLVVLELATGVETVLGELPGFGAPRWAPDSTRLAVAAYHTAYRTETSEIWVVEVTDGSHRVVTDGGQGWSAGEDVWSPDGRRLALHDHAGPGQGSRLTVVAADGSDATALTEPGDLGRVAWSPDSAWVLYDDDPDGDGVRELFQAAIDGSDRFRVAVDASDADWSHRP